MANITAFAAIILYLSSFFLLLQQVKNKSSLFSKAFTLCFSLALLAHISSLHFSVFPNQTFNIGFFKASSLIFCVISIISLISVIRKLPVANLLLALFPCAAISVGVAQWVAVGTPKLITGSGLISHIVLSLLAYSLMTLASLQALLLAAQENQLKQHDFKGIFHYLPPLQTMETLLFELIWLGFILLSLAIGSGFIFFEDMFAQHLAHKTFFSLLAWVIFAVLLYGRHAQGWRGTTATKWTIGGFIALMFAYFGTKFVLEILL